MSGVRRLVISIFLVGVLLAGQATMVGAAYVALYDVTYSQTLQADDNGNTYLFLDKPTDFIWGEQQLVHDEDIDATSYTYYSSSWSTDSGYLNGPASRSMQLVQFGLTSMGWLHNWSILPSFWEFDNTTMDNEISIEDSRVIFPLPIGADSSVVIDPGNVYVGVFNVTNQEYFHLIVGGRQDSTSVMVIIQDSSGRFYSFDSLEGGDIILLPFAPDGPGMYFVTMFSNSLNSGLDVGDLRLEVVTPEELQFGEVVEGILPGSEQVVKANPGDIVHEEKAPTAHTFKFSANSTHPGSLRYAINHPELDSDIYVPFETLVHVTSSTWYHEGPMTRYWDFLSNNGDTYNYQSFQNETYYITIIGMEETTYLLLNEMPDTPLLPLNQPFYIESPWNTEVKHLFRLPLGQDSVIKVNSTESGGFDWDLWRVFDDNVYRRISVPDSSTFHNAQPIYLPAGNYLLEAKSGGADYWGIYEFSAGPIVDGTGGVAVDNGGLIGVRVPVDAMSIYGVNISLITHDNVTVTSDYDIMNTYGNIVRGWSGNLANIQSGTSWVGNPLNWTAEQFGVPTSYTMFCDGDAIIIVSPSTVRNNTAGLTNFYPEYTVDYNVVFEENSADLFNGTGTLDVTTSGGWHNFTLGDPWDPIEIYQLTVTTTRGTWLNVSYYTTDVDSFNDVFIYMEDEGCTTKLDLTDLAATMSGTVDAANFRVGAISNEISIIFHLNREQVAEGSLDIFVEQFTTNTYLYPPAIMYVGPGAGAVAADYSGLVVVAGVGGLAVAVVVVLFVARKRGLLTR
ncbi:MAG: hypothetical protein ACXABF_13915 [Candidatus Thorarchaeota archaeon]|jgi:hypothetical protein